MKGSGNVATPKDCYTLLYSFLRMNCTGLSDNFFFSMVTEQLMALDEGIFNVSIRGYKHTAGVIRSDGMMVSCL